MTTNVSYETISNPSIPLPNPTGVPLEEEESDYILKLSTSLQSRLIWMLAGRSDLKMMLDTILAEVKDRINTDACSIYMIDPLENLPKGERRAYMWAALGYHNNGLKDPDHVAFCRVLPPHLVPIKPANVEEKLGLTGWVISTGQSFLAKYTTDVISHPHWKGTFDLIQKPEGPLHLAAFLAVPIRNLEGQVIGALKAEREVGKNAFSVENQIALEALARVAGKCITYQPRALQSTGEVGGSDGAITAWSLDVIHEADATEGEMDTFLEIVVQVTAAAAQADACSIFLKDENLRTLTQRAGIGNLEQLKGIRSYRMPDPVMVEKCRKTEDCCPAECPGAESLPREKRLGLTVWVALTGKSFYAPNFDKLKKHCHHLGQFDSVNYDPGEVCGAWYGVPLRVGGEVIGVIKIENSTGTAKRNDAEFGPFTRQRIDVLASDIALSIERLMLQSPARYKIIQKAMPSAIKILQGGIDVRALANLVVNETTSLFHARACALFLKEGDWLIQPEWAATGWAGLGKKSRRYRLVPEDAIKDNPRPEEKVGLTVWIAVKKKKFMAKSNLELKSHPHHRGVYDPVNFKPDEKCESFLGMPMLLNDGKELIGVLKVETKMRNKDGRILFAYFNEQDELAFNLISNVAAIAIQNARLLEPRLLAERVMKQQDLNMVFETLHAFIAGREDVFKALEGAAQILSDQDQNRATFIRAFAGLLDPNFNLRILEETRDRVKGVLQAALDFFYASLKAESVNRLHELIQGREMSELLSKQFFLNESASFLYNMLTEIDPLLKKYLDEPVVTANLVESQSILSKYKQDAADLYLFERVLAERVLAHWKSILVYEMSRLHEVPNPYVPGRPLPANSPVFVGRKDILDWIEKSIFKADKRNMLILYGGWHTGKTSILKQIEAGSFGQDMRERDNQPIYPVFVDLQGIPILSTASFLLNLARKIADALLKCGVECERPQEKEFLEQYQFYYHFEKFLDGVIDILKKRNNGLLVLMLDEFELLDEAFREKRVDRQIFRYLRSFMQHKDMIFILAGRHTLDDMDPEFKTRFLSVTIKTKVGFLSEMECRQLIIEPVQPYAITYSEDAIRRIYRLTGGQPYFVQQLCWNCVDLFNEKIRHQNEGENDRQPHQLVEHGPKKSETVNGKKSDITDEMVIQAMDRSLENSSILETVWYEETDSLDHQILRLLAQRNEANGVFSLTAEEIATRIGVDPNLVRTSLEKMAVNNWLWSGMNIIVSPLRCCGNGFLETNVKQ
jgi:GAF domain-containing protein